MYRFISLSAPLIQNSKNFLNIKKTTLFESIKYIFSNKISKLGVDGFSLVYLGLKSPISNKFYVTFVGWGRKKSGLWATKMSKLTNNNFLLLEDGFIRSFDLGVEGSPSFSIVKDDVGIYYDATTPSRLENIFNSYDFKSDKELMRLAREARAKIIKYKISKYNNSKNIDLSYLDNTKDKILIVAQTYGDSSLKYGLAEKFTTKEMIDDALRDNPNGEIYIKIHPDVLSGKKKSDINQEDIPTSCHILKENYNPIELIRYFSKIYTKTSGMGFEALLLGKEVHCYGMPFYAGWGVTKDKQELERRRKKLTVDELFAGGYILYTDYYNPYIKKKTDIIGIIEYINLKKRE